MLTKLVKFEDEITLVVRSGIQFVDFGLTLDPRKLGEGAFALAESRTSLLRLDYDEASGNHVDPDTRKRVQSTLEAVPVADSLKLLDDTWLPVPFLRLYSGSRFDAGPTNWARARLVALGEGEDEDGHTHRVVFAFDTNIDETHLAGSAYLAPVEDEVRHGTAKYALAWHGRDPNGFVELPWVSAWLAKLFEENARLRLRMDPEDVRAAVDRHEFQAHYLNLLWVLGSSLREPDRAVEKPTPQIVLLAHGQDRSLEPIEVDLVLDVGNSRTVGILIESHPQEADGLRDRYVLQLRDLTRPHHVYDDPFESRVEFAEAVFGKVDYSCQSGRNGFLWPTIARIGPEATRLASRRRGTEGSTGLSSPKRYLWDEDRYVPGWRFNDAFNKAETEPLATAAPFSELINDLGEALYLHPDDLPVFHPHYSRSSLMTHMLAEVLAQALMQMNSAGQRMKQRQSLFPRHLRTVVLTAPPSMPKAERQIFEDRVRQAIGLVWKAMGWHPQDAPVDFKPGAPACCPPLPTVLIQWDEATCAQVVWLYSEIINHFGGRPEEFFRAARKPRPDPGDGRSLRVASIDVGGGTTDLVVTDYDLDGGRGANVYIRPIQHFRDGFKVAGDDILLEVINRMVVPPIEAALRAMGVHDPGPAISRIMGAEAGDVQEKVLRQQLAVQILYPLALEILKAYERYDPLARPETRASTVAEVLAGNEPPSAVVLDYVERCVRQVAGVEGFELLSVHLPIDPDGLHDLFLNDEMEICKTIRSLSEVVHLYDCDWLLLSGRPTRLPGVQAVFRALLPLPPDRILPMHNYRTGDWYPFSSQHRIIDPKTTAAVGAALCMLCKERRLPNFFFQSQNLTLTSTMRHLGMVDGNMILKDEDVYYRDIDLDDAEYDVDPEASFQMRGPMTLGFRQLSAARWGASPLYRLEFRPAEAGGGETNRAREVLDRTSREDGVLQVRLKRSRAPRGYDHFDIAEVTRQDGATIPARSLRLRLMTLNAVGLEENSYWLDTGSIVR